MNLFRFKNLIIRTGWAIRCLQMDRGVGSDHFDHGSAVYTPLSTNYEFELLNPPFNSIIIL